MTENQIDLYLHSLPPIRRARGHRLYAENGRRILDLWQDGGRGVLGARHAKLGLGLKTAIDRGLDRPVPSRLAERLRRLALERLPGTLALRIYRDEGRALAALAALTGNDRPFAPGLGLLDSPLVADPARSALLAADAGLDATRPLAVLDRPFARWLPENSGPRPAIVIPFLPLPRGTGPVIIAIADRELATKAGEDDLVSPLALRAAVDGLSALASLESEDAEARWRRFDQRSRHLFERRGPWLFARPEFADWDRVFRAAFDRGLLLSPDPARPSLVPLDFDDGEIAPLEDILP